MIGEEVELERRKLILVTEEDIGLERGKRLHSPFSISHLYRVGCEAIASNNVMEVKLDFPLIESYGTVRFIGSVNGLLCLCHPPDDIFLFNPVTKDLKRIPNSPIDAFFRFSNRNRIHGFGYDQSYDDYHVVKILYGNEIKSNAYIYSLITNTWRRARSCPYRISSLDLGVSLNGAVHWVSDRSMLIVAFDFAREKFRELPRPSTSGDNLMSTMGVLGGCLFCQTFNAAQHDLWLMKEYGVKESWIKITSLVRGVPQSLTALRPLGYLRNNDEVLLERDGSLVVCNPRKHTIKQVSSIRGVRGKLRGIGTYVESLISPHNVWNVDP